LKVRKAACADTKVIVALWKEMVRLHSRFDRRLEVKRGAEKQFARWIKENLGKKDSLVLVAEDENGVTGFCLAILAKNPPVKAEPVFGLISDLAVTQKSRRHGIGTLLVEKALAWFANNGVGHVQLSAAHYNPLAQDFWRKLGFTDFMDVLWKNTADRHPKV
jgi:ribosomal protein S18 acetylase RimI-like enzyme